MALYHLSGRIHGLFLRHTPFHRLLLSHYWSCETPRCSHVSSTGLPHDPPAHREAVSWPTAILSPAACRVILNMYLLSFRIQSAEGRRVNRNDSSFTDTDIQFTSFFGLSGFDDQSMAANRPSEPTGNKRSQGSASFASDSNLSSLSDFSLCQPHSATQNLPQAPASLLLMDDLNAR